MNRTTVLLNPPGRDTYLRDYFCSKISQADYLNPPIDLVCLSGWLAKLGPVHLVDAIVDRLSVPACLLRVSRHQPDIVVGLLASVSLAEDVEFYRKLRETFAGKLILSGDILLEGRAQRLRELPFADALIHDFAGKDLLAYLRGSPPRRLANLTVRIDGRIHQTPLTRKNTVDCEQPVPVHQLFIDRNYRYPFVRGRPFATILTDFGCPYPCEFCVMSTLGWKLRPISSVIAELDGLKELGVREIFFLDQTFGLDRRRTAELLRQMGEPTYQFGWVCFTRPDLISSNFLDQMKKAGCHTLIMGLESGSEKILAAAGKGYGQAEIKRGFEMARQQGFRTVATVILGLPEEDRASFEATLRLLRLVEPDFASFNVAVPRLGTPLRQRAIDLGLADAANLVMDQSGNPPAMATLQLSREEVLEMRQRAVRQFYFRPSYLWKRLTGAYSAASGSASWSEFAEDTTHQLAQGIALARRQLQRAE